jgi:hypothetical protein
MLLGYTVNNSQNEPLAEDTEVVIDDNYINVDGNRCVRGLGLFRNVTIRDNEITGDSNRGIEFAGGFESRIENNNINLTDGVEGITVWATSTIASIGNTIARNTLTGSATYGIRVGDVPPYPRSSDDNSFVGNDLSELNTDIGIFTTGLSIGNHFANNILGSASGWGVLSTGTGNEFHNTTFSGDYLGFGFLPVFVVLNVGSQLNEVTSVKDATPPYAFDVCDQVVDLNTPVTTNIVPGYGRCDAQSADVLALVEEMIAEKRLEMDRAKGEALQEQ